MQSLFAKPFEMLLPVTSYYNILLSTTMFIVDYYRRGIWTIVKIVNSLGSFVPRN